jgi:hypothetical protein
MEKILKMFAAMGTVPQRLKPASSGLFNGTAEAVPLRKISAQEIPEAESESGAN